MSEEKRSLGKRIQALVTIGGIPGAICGFVGDFFNPSGGWLFPGILGAVALIVSVYLLASLTLKGDRVDDIWWVRYTGESERWIWEARSPFLAHGLHIVFVFAAVCLLISQKSFAASSEGGILAEKVDAIAVAQRQLGISERILAEQVKATTSLQSIDTKADNFKRENSDNPRKELANRGILWNPDQFGQAVLDNDVQTVELFLKGGMRINDDDALRATRPVKPQIITLLVQHHSQFNQPDCERMFGRVLDQNSLKSTDGHIVRMVKGLCSSEEARSFVAQKRKEAEARQAEAITNYKRALANRKAPKDCVKDLTKDSGRNLLDEAARFNILNVTTLSGRENLLAHLNTILLFGHSESGHRESEIMAAIHKYCEEAADIKPPSEAVGNEIKYWTTISDWLT